jgi:hypothetical protein
VEKEEKNDKEELEEELRNKLYNKPGARFPEEKQYGDQPTN